MSTGFAVAGWHNYFPTIFNNTSTTDYKKIKLSLYQYGSWTFNTSMLMRFRNNADSSTNVEFRVPTNVEVTIILPPENRLVIGSTSNEAALALGRVMELDEGESTGSGGGGGGELTIDLDTEGITTLLENYADSIIENYVDNAVLNYVTSFPITEITYI